MEINLVNEGRCSDKTMPKVLIIVATDAIGGVGKGLFQFFKHATNEKFDYILCNYNIKNRQAGQFVRKARKQNLKIELLKQRAVIDPLIILQARKLVIDNDINIIQTHAYKSNILGFCLKLLFNMRWIGYAHGYTDDNMKIRIYNFLDRNVLRYADIVVAVSNSTKELLKRFGVKGSKIKVVYNAIDINECKPTIASDVIKDKYGINKDQKVIGVVGRLNPEKGQLLFIKAFRNVIKELKDVKALIVGDGQDKNMLEEFCQKNGLDNKVIFTGQQEVVANFYQVFDLLVLPSLSEGLPNTVLEAMSFGIPVLATSVGGVPEIINNDNGVLVPPNDEEALTKKMLELLSDDEFRNSIGKKGRGSLGRRFSPLYRVQQIVGLYKGLLSNKN